MSQPIAQVSVDQLPADAVVLDVREDHEWESGHIDGATHVPLASIPERLAEVPIADPLYVICRVGGRSAQATAWLGAQGRTAVNVDGGMLAWESAGKPMVSENGQQPEVD